MSSFKYDVFLSHNKSDKPAVEELARRLLEQDITPWLDDWNLIPGKPWQEDLESALANCATCAVFMGPSGISPWQNEEMRAAIDRRVRESSFRVIPVLLPGAQREERSRLPAFMVATTWVEFRKSLNEEEAYYRLICGIQGKEPGPLIRDREQPIENMQPYRGLESFYQEHARFFFGREALTEWLLNELQLSYGPKETNRFLAIIGASGSGKSSLARAGLVSALKQGAIGDSKNWPIVILRPGQDPLESLAIAISAEENLRQFIPPIKTIISEFSDDKKALHWAVRKALHGMPETSRVFLLIDQFEEIFTLCHDDTRRKAFIKNVLYAANVVGGQTVVVLTMRADFYSRCARYGTLAAALSDHQFLVGPMTEEELRNAIERPAQMVGCELEPGLAETLITDFNRGPGTLPLLQHALLELWISRKGRQLTNEAYQNIGGIEGALEQRAEQVYDQLTKAERKICRQILLRLTQAGTDTDDTKRIATLEELITIETKKKLVEKVIQTLSGPDARLITIDGGEELEEQSVEVVHEALIRGWSRLQAWLDEDREFLLWRQRLRIYLSQRKQAPHDKDTLLRGAPLVEARRWLEGRSGNLNSDEKSYIETSVKQETRGRRRRAIFLLITLFLALGTALFTFSQWRKALKNEKTAKIQADNLTQARDEIERRLLEAERLARTAAPSQMLSFKALRQKESGNNALAALLARQAYLFHNSGRVRALYQVDEALRKILNAPFFNHVMYGQGWEIRSVALSPDGKTLASGGNGGPIWLWDLENLLAKPKILRGHKIWVYSISFSPDGKILASAGADGTIRLWNLHNSTSEPIVLSEHRANVTSVAFSPDGKTLASAGEDDTVRLWNLQNPTPNSINQLPHDKSVRCVAFSPDGKTLASAGDDDTVMLWDLRNITNEPIALHGHGEGHESVVFSPDGRYIAAAGGALEEGVIQLWDLHRSTSKPIAVRRSKSLVGSISFSPDGKILAAASWDNKIQLWNIPNLTAGSILQTGHSNRVLSVSFSPDGKYLASGGDEPEKIIQLWDLQKPIAESMVLRHKDEIISVAFSPDGKLLASGSWDKSIRLWDLQKPTTEPLVLLHKDKIISVAFSPDGKLLASGSWDKSIQLWDLQKPTANPKLLEGHEEGVSAVAFSPDGKLLASGSWDKSIRLWDLQKPTANPIILRGHEKGITSVAFSPDGKTLASGSCKVYSEYTAGSVRLWDLQNLAANAVIMTGSKRGAFSVSFSPNGNMLAAGSSKLFDKGIIYLWDLQHLDTMPIAMRGHLSYARSLAFSPDGTTIASGGPRDVLLWDLKNTKSEPAILRGHKGTINSVAFSPDGKTIASGSSDGTTFIWLSTTSLSEKVCEKVKRNLTHDEWNQFVGKDFRYERTCPELPVEEFE
jgi:WD40 repeat protein